MSLDQTYIYYIEYSDSLIECSNKNLELKGWVLMGEL
jgi:hypothetical protein